jgi:LysR family transcriptional regulator, cys regulon transcriptional activator
MNLQQLRYLCTVIDQDFNVSQAARSLHTTQPGVSKQIRLLERELGVELLVRRGNRIVSMTDPGKAAADIAMRVVRDIANLKTLGEEFTASARGRLAIASTHVHARYWLLPVIVQFGKRFPNVQLKILRGTTTQVVGMVQSGEAQIGVCTLPEDDTDELLLLPCHKVERAVLVPPKHPLLRKRRITLSDLANYPLIIQTAASSGGWTVLQAFEAQGLRPNVVLEVVDATMAKACVEQNIGITVLPMRVFDRKRDVNLRAINAGHLFAPLVIHTVIHRNSYLRSYANEFICMFAPDWDGRAIESVRNKARAQKELR